MREAFQNVLRSLRRTAVRTAVGGVVVVGTLEVTTHAPSQGRSSPLYHSIADEVVTPLLRRFLQAEQAHHLAVEFLSQYPQWVPTHRPSPVEQSMTVSQTLWGLNGSMVNNTNPSKNIKSLTFSNPIGLAAGFDKDGQAMQPLLDLGFGFVEIGSVTLKPQPGNPSPRMFRLLADEAIINRYGFNSEGVNVVQKRLEDFRNHQRESLLQQPTKMDSSDSTSAVTKVPQSSWWQNLYSRSPAIGPVGVNLGKNKTSETPIEDYQHLIHQLGPYADYLVINVSSPNTPGLRDLQSTETLEELLKACLEARDSIQPPTGSTVTDISKDGDNNDASNNSSSPWLPPLLVKLSPDLTNDELEEIAKVLMKLKVDGIILTNTTTDRTNVQLQSPNKHEIGGLSGRPLQSRSTECIRLLYTATNGRIPIIGVGGIFTAHDVYEKLCAGASLVQVYTGMVYQGPGMVSQLRRDLAQVLRDNGFRRIEDVIGVDHEALHWKRQHDLAQQRLQQPKRTNLIK